MSPKKRDYKICARCAMDTSDPWISFDFEGNCNHCCFFLDTKIKVINKKATPGALDSIIEQIKIEGRTSKFDCVVGLSGGVDSSYVAMKAAQRGLRVLGVHMDNGWNSSISVENINKLVKNYKLGFASYVLPWSDFRAVQLAFLRASVPEVETPTDTAIQRALHVYARKYNIKYILSGGNTASEGILPASWHYNAKDTKLIQCMACAIPVVASPVGANVYAVPPSCGFLASSSDQWLSAFRHLADNPDLRHRMGVAGRHWVEDRYSLHSALPLLTDLIRTVSISSNQQPEDNP